MLELKYLTLKGFAAAEPRYGLGSGASLHLCDIAEFYKIDVERFKVIAIHCHYQSGVAKTSSGTPSYITIDLICEVVENSTPQEETEYVSIALGEEKESENKLEHPMNECESPILRTIFDKISIVLAESTNYKDFNFADMPVRRISLEEARINTKD